MSYFIFNGIRSDDKKVIPESLPPIVKPPERYDIIRVDGSNKIGIDIKGYDAYEKTIPLGLWDTDLTEVSNWLRGKGQLILSNETEKYYDAYVLQQIDYTKALRFRKANVTFLVQPYKHSSDEDETESRTLINQGNTDCLPLITIYGTGYVGVYVNGVLQCTVNISQYITLDGEEEEAYKGSILQNRSMVGNFPVFTPGENALTFTGNVTNVTTLVRSRWL